MALKDIWTNKTDDVDDILADDINAIANEVISNTENKADKATTYTATETDDMLSTKADKSDLDWKLIGETETTEEYVESVILDFGEPIEKWYRETRMDIYIPKSSAFNTENGKMCIVFSQSEADAGYIGDVAVNSGISLPLVASQSNSFAPMLYNYNYHGTVITEWDKNGKPIYSHILILGFGARSSPYTAYGVSRYEDNFNIKKKQFLALQPTPPSSGTFKFPAGTKISLYGRL